MWAVKIPLYEPFNRLDGPTEIWETVDEFETQEEAIQFAKYEFGSNDEGNIQLVYEEL